MTRETMRNSLYRLLRNRTDVTEDIANTALWDAYVRLCRGRFVDAERTRRNVTLYFPELVSFNSNLTPDDLAVGTATLSYILIPSTIDAVIGVVLRDSLTTFALKMAQLPKLLTTLSDSSTTPQYYTISGNRILISPRYTSSDYETHVVYYAMPATWASDAAVPEIPDAFHSLIPLLAAVDLSYQFAEDERAAALSNQFYARLNEIQPSRWLRSAFSILMPMIVRG